LTRKVFLENKFLEKVLKFFGRLWQSLPKGFLFEKYTMEISSKGF